MVLQIIVLIVCGLFQATLASSINYSVGTTLVLGEFITMSHQRQLQSSPACAFLSTSSGSGYGFVAVTVFESSGEVFGSNELSSSISSYLKKDDVFNEAFLEGCSNVLRVGLSYLRRRVAQAEVTCLIDKIQTLLCGIYTDHMGSNSVDPHSWELFRCSKYFEQSTFLLSFELG